MKSTKLFLLAIVVVLAGCGAQAKEAAKSGDPGSEADYGMNEASASAPSRQQDASSSVAKLISNETPAMKRDVVKTGSLTVQVENVDKAEKLARQITEAAGGRVDQVASSDLAGPAPSIDMTLRIPVTRFESSMEKLEALGVRMAKQVTVSDVTEQLVDMDARMKTMLAQEEVVRKMLRNANNLGDSLTINNDLTRLRGEIESINAQRKSLSGQAAHSTLELKLTQNATAVAVASTDPNWFQTSWAAAWGAGNGAFRSVVSILMWLVVFSPIWLGFIFGMRWIIRLAQRNSPVSASAEGQRPV